MKTINESFICLNCQQLVPAAQGTCRNHCPYCRVSQHVDGDIPGDRATSCHGLMYPTTYEIANGMIKVTFQCIKCHKIHRNKILSDDSLMILDEKIAEYKIIFERTFIEQISGKSTKKHKWKGRIIKK